MKHLLILLLTLLPCYRVVAQQSTQLDAHAVAVFPASVTKEEQEAGMIWRSDLDTTDATKGQCIVVRMPAGKAGLSAKELKKQAKDPAFFKSFLKGMLRQLPGVTILSQTMIENEGTTFHELLMEKDIPDENFP